MRQHPQRPLGAIACVCVCPFQQFEQNRNSLARGSPAKGLDCFEVPVWIWHKRLPIGKDCIATRFRSIIEVPKMSFRYPEDNRPPVFAPIFGEIASSFRAFKAPSRTVAHHVREFDETALVMQAVKGQRRILCKIPTVREPD